MKQTIIILFFLVLARLCLAIEQSQLPEEPWRAIAVMGKNNSFMRWEENISIKLFGSFTQTDSLMVENSIKILNELCETVKLSVTTRDRGNLEFFFLDSTNDKVYESIVYLNNDQESNWSVSYREKALSHFDLAIRAALIPENSRQNFLTNKLAYALYPHSLSSNYMFKNGREIRTMPISIFNREFSVKDTDSTKWIKYVPPFYSDFSDFDRQLIKTVYAANFTELLPIARKQFDPIPSWLRDNSKKLMVFPYILALFLFSGLIILFYKKLGIKIQNRLLQFNVISVIALLTVGILGSLYIVTSSNLEDPYFSFYDFHDIIGGILVLIILGLPSLNLIRLIEIAIHRKTHHKYFKVLLLFLSTCLIPSGTVFSIVYLSSFSAHENLDKGIIKIVSIFFLIFIIIAVIRALISFFILKEKELKIETEVKLANLRELKTKAELNALHSKINPHFLYNALNSIAGLAKTDPKKTEHMALSLSKLFRYSINKEQTDWSTFAEEMEMVRIYLDIEKVRFDDRLEFTIGLPDELKTVKVPRFIVQPLVENAIKHGISKLVTKGEIRATVRPNDKWIEIVVADNGPDFPNELAPGFGLQSIYDKLEIMYPNRFEMHFLNAPDKQILIKLA